MGYFDFGEEQDTEKIYRRRTYLNAVLQDHSAFERESRPQEEIEAELKRLAAALPDESAYQLWLGSRLSAEFTLSRRSHLVTCRYTIPQAGRTVFWDSMPESQVSDFAKNLELAAPGARILSEQEAADEEAAHYTAPNCCAMYDDNGSDALSGTGTDADDWEEDDGLGDDFEEELFDPWNLSAKTENLFRERLSLEADFAAEPQKAEYIVRVDQEDMKEQCQRLLDACTNEYACQVWKSTFLEAGVKELKERGDVFVYTFGNPHDEKGEKDLTDILDPRSYEVNAEMNAFIGYVLKKKRKPTEMELRYFAAKMAISSRRSSLRDAL